MIVGLNIQIVLAIVFIAWHYALRCGFISDDHAVVAQRIDIIPDAERNPTKEPYWIKVFNDGIVMYFINAVMTKLGLRRIPLAWHTLCLGLHLLNCYLLHLVLTPIIGLEMSLVATLLWGINPMLNQCTVWVSGRPYLIATMFALVIMLNWHQPIIVLPLFILGVITNVSIGLLPIMLKILHPGWQTTVYLIFMITGGTAWIVWKFNKRFSAALVLDRDNFRFTKRRFNTIVRIISYYVWGMFVPTKMGWYHQAGFRYNEKWEKFNVWTLISWVIAVTLIQQGFAGWWLILGVLPNANMFATNSFVQDRYVYWGGVGLAIIMAPIVMSHPMILPIAVTFYVTRSYMYSRQMVDDESMYRENWRNHPQSDYAINNLSFFLIKQMRFEEARVVIMRGLVINQSNKMLWYNLGVTWAATGHLGNDEGKFRFLKAIDCWKQALNIEPRWTKPAQDLQKMMKFLVDNKVLTIDKGESAAGMPTIEIPTMKKPMLWAQMASSKRAEQHIQKMNKEIEKIKGQMNEGDEWKQGGEDI